MLLDDGVLYICTLETESEGGSMPVENLKRTKRYWFGERSVGYSRQYAAKGAGEQIDMLVRIPHDRGVRIGMYAILGNGEQFRIENVQNGEEYSYFYSATGQESTGGLRYTDLTLRRLDRLYDVAE